MRTICIIFILLAGIIAAHAQTADEIMQKHIEAMGGPNCWSKVKSIEMRGIIRENGFEIEVTHILTGKGSLTTTVLGGYTNKWIIIPQGDWSGIQELDSTKVDTLTAYNAIFYHPFSDYSSSQLLNYKARGMKAGDGGLDTIANVPCYRVTLTDAKGKKLIAFIDAKTWYLKRVEGVQQTEDGGKDLFVTYDNYEKHGDAIVPMTCKNQNTGVPYINEIIFSKAEINVPADESLFALKNKTK